MSNEKQSLGNETSGLEEKLKGYKPSVALGQAGGLAATYFGVKYADAISKYIPSLSSIVDTTFGKIGLGAVSNFIGDHVGFAASLYAYNRDKYKGIKGKYKFVKDNLDLGVRHFGSYFITYPLAAAASYIAITTGLMTGAAAVTAPYLIESLITGLGYFFSTKKYRAGLANAAPH